MAIFFSLPLLSWACDEGAASGQDGSGYGADSQDSDSRIDGVDSESSSTENNNGEATETDTRSPLCAAYCETMDRINEAVGCHDPCHCASECEEFWAAWLECVLEAPREQCYCEPDGNLNCEGSFKDDEGAALCIEEYQLVYYCTGPETPTITEFSDMEEDDEPDTVAHFR